MDVGGCLIECTLVLGSMFFLLKMVMFFIYQK